MPLVRKMTTLIAVGTVFFSVAATAPAIHAETAATPPLRIQAPDGETPKELFEGATRMAMKALELLIKTLPQYEPPVVLENGDILIRRKRTGDQPGGGTGPDQDRI